MECGKICPFTECCTIASTCMKVFRRNFLIPNTIGIIPSRGYRRAHMQSEIALQWLLFCEKEMGREIIHAAKGWEYRLVQGMLVDGFLEGKNGEKSIVFEFQGCYYHGCPSCYKSRSEELDEAHARTQRKNAIIRSLGYELREMYECEFKKMKNSNPELKKMIESDPYLSKATINPRDCFSGGRTENFLIKYEVKDNEKIKYLDFCSMYPFCLKNKKFPQKHPKIYVGDDCKKLSTDVYNLIGVEGIVKCSVLPPRNLFLPVLGIKSKGRLIFGLCRRCCEEARKSDCNHEDINDRKIEGVWVADELKKAIEVGYKILEVFVIWQYEMVEYDKVSKKGGLFAEYVNTFLKYKQEASGWPDECDTD